MDLLNTGQGKSRPIAEAAIHSLIEFSTAHRIFAAAVVWKELWLNIGIKPAVVGKKQVLY